MKDIKIGAYSTKNLGIKDQNENWYNFSKDDSDYSEDQVKDFLDSKIDKGDKIKLDLNDDGDYTKIVLDKEFKQGKKVSNSGKSDTEKNINKNVALKCATELCKDDFPDTVGKQEVVDLAKRFEIYLNEE